jgi:hypothetical protein
MRKTHPQALENFAKISRRLRRRPTMIALPQFRETKFAGR